MSRVEPLHQMGLPNEPAAYRSARNALLQQEVDLRRHIEQVAELRRALPLGGEVGEDYVFAEWDEGTDAAKEVHLSELFSPGKDTLFIYSFMFVPDGLGDPIGGPCPSFTSIIDAVSGEAPHVAHRVNLAVSAKAPIERFRQHGQNRGWQPVRLLSAGNSTYRDYLAEGEDGSQFPMATVFVRRNGGIYHLWSSELFYVPNTEGETRHVDFMWPVWGIFDCTRDGRGAGGPRLTYGPTPTSTVPT